MTTSCLKEFKGSFQQLSHTRLHLTTLLNISILMKQSEFSLNFTQQCYFIINAVLSLLITNYLETPYR